MVEVNPETNELVKAVSRTTQLRVANSEERSAHNRAIADIVSTIEERAWRRGWLIGVVMGVACSVAGYWSYVLLFVQ